MKILRHPWLALFLIFCLPAQALASVLIECEQHLTEARATDVLQAVSGDSEPNHDEQTGAAAPDCHGTSNIRLSADTTASPNTGSNAGLNTNADNTSCFHCSGACQNLKPLSLIAKNQHPSDFDKGVFSPLIQATEAGVHGNPARPPCPPVLS